MDPALRSSEPESRSFSAVLRSTLEHQRAGELIVRLPHSDAEVFAVAGRVFLYAGQVAWAHCEGRHGYLLDALIRRHALPKADLEALLAECRRRARNFADYLVDLGLLSEAEMRDTLRAHIAHQVGELERTYERGAGSYFLPTQRSFQSRFLFPADEVLSAAATTTSVKRTENAMANVKETLARILEIDGALGACVVDSNSGMMLGGEGGGPVNLEIAAAGNTEVVRAKRKTMRALELTDAIEDMLITLGSQYHLIRPLKRDDALFIYLVLDKQKGNLAMARHQLARLEKELVI